MVLGLVRLNQNVAWYIARSSGLVAWVLVTASVLWGLIYAGRLTRKLPPPAWNLDVHRFLGGLSVSFIIIHILALSADKYVDFGLREILLPFASTWKPGPVAWGIVAMYLLVAVEATSLAMRWLPRKLWRKVHLLTFVLFVMSTIHAWQTGTDITNTLVRAVGVGTTTAAIFTAVLRIIWARRRQAAKAAAPEPRPSRPTPSPTPAPEIALPLPVAAMAAADPTPADSADEWGPEPVAGPAAVITAPRPLRPDRLRPPPLPPASRPVPVAAAAATNGRTRVPRDFFAPTRLAEPPAPGPDSSTTPPEVPAGGKGTRR